MKRKSGKKAASKSRIPEVLPAEDSPETLDLSDNNDEEEDTEVAEDAEPSEEEVASSLPATRNRTALPIEITESEVSAISPTDPLRRYLDEIRRYPLLDAQDEFALVAQLRNTGDMDAARRLVQANLRLVVKIAMEYRSIYSNLLDLIQEGNIGLMKAVSKFDPTKGARLGYYSSWWIRSYILKYLLDNFRLVKIGTTQAQKKLFYHLMREKERLEAQGLLAGPKLLAEKLNVREKDVIEMEQRLSGRGVEMSIDTPVNSSEEGGATHRDLLQDPHEATDEILARNQILDLLKSKLPAFEKQLNEKELRILKDRLLAEEPKTLQEVADLYGLTRERARQIEAKVLIKLREFLAPSLR
ncbi:RNA polymerase factor sigma-32 [Bdellovibrionota bacterium FG-1]